MKRKIMTAICHALILYIFTGCQLATESAAAETNEDRLSGVFVTTEHLDLFDFEGYINDNLNSFSGGEIVIDGDMEKYQGRLYATLATKTLTNEETGETSEIEEYVFEEIEGIPYFAIVMTDATREGSSYTTSVSGEGISGGKMAINHGDAEKIINLEGTIYVSTTGQNQAYYFNPVYQCEDGSVYLIPGSGISASMSGEGMEMSQTMDAAYTVSENGDTMTESVSVKLSIHSMYKPEKIVILQMDATSNILLRTEYAPDKVPGTLVTEQDAEYLVVETHKQDDEGNLKISRNIYGGEDEYMETFFARPDGICIERSTRIEWYNKNQSLGEADPGGIT